MGILTLCILAIGLSFDTFAVSISCGIIIKEIKFLNATKIAISLAIFQALMPVLGWAIGYNIKDFIIGFDHWIAFGLLAVLGAKFIYESLKPEETKKYFNPLNPKVLISMSIATSIDAFIVGIGFAILETNILLATFIIGAITFIASMLGIFFGKKLGNKFGKTFEILGGVILIVIGTKILIEHLFF